METLTDLFLCSRLALLMHSVGSGNLVENANALGRWVLSQIVYQQPLAHDVSGIRFSAKPACSIGTIECPELCKLLTLARQSA